MQRHEDCLFTHVAFSALVLLWVGVFVLKTPQESCFAATSFGRTLGLLRPRVRPGAYEDRRVNHTMTVIFASCMQSLQDQHERFFEDIGMCFLQDCAVSDCDNTSTKTHCRCLKS